MPWFQKKKQKHTDISTHNTNQKKKTLKTEQHKPHL